MAYCTYCGKETSAKKICEHCGVKMKKFHNFCAWCGTELDPNAKICPNCKEPKKNRTGFFGVLGYIFTFMCLISVFGDYTVLGAVFFALVALLAFPLTKKLIIKVTHTKIKARKPILLLRALAVIVLFVVAIGTAPETNDTSSDSPFVDESEIIEQEEEVRDLTDAEIEYLTVQGLYDKIDGNSNYKNDLDVEATRYRIANVEEKDGKYYVYGSGTFIDKYGNVCRPYGDNSGSATFDFEVCIIKESQRILHCKIK